MSWEAWGDDDDAVDWADILLRLGWENSEEDDDKWRRPGDEEWMSMQETIEVVEDRQILELGDE